MDLDSQLVAGLIAETCAELVLPRFRSLTAGEVWAKAGGELVTTVDLAVEQRLAELLPSTLPGSVLVGEEGLAKDPGKLGLVRSGLPVWLVDPLDGTARFVAGDAGFSTMVALVRGGVIEASWICAPALDLQARAVRGGGAYLGDRRCRLTDPAAELIVVTDQAFQTAEDRGQVDRLAMAGYRTRPCVSVGLAYLDLISGAAGGAVFGWTKPWDHAPGVLLHAEAGGSSSVRDGGPMRADGSDQPPLVLAASATAAQRLRRCVLGIDDQPPRPPLGPDG